MKTKKIATKAISVIAMFAILISIFNGLTMSSSAAGSRYSRLQNEINAITVSRGYGYRAVVDNDGVDIKRAYEIDSFTSRMICVKISQYSNRSSYDLYSELAIHQALYKYGVARSSTRDAYLDFNEDGRWYLKYLCRIYGCTHLL